MAVALRGHGLPGSLGKTSKRLGIADGDVGEHLAVELDAGLAEAVHELAVAHALAPRGGVDPDDPQAAEVTLAVAAGGGGGGGRPVGGVPPPPFGRGGPAAGGPRPLVGG